MDENAGCEPGERLNQTAAIVRRRSRAADGSKGTEATRREPPLSLLTGHAILAQLLAGPVFRRSRCSSVRHLISSHRHSIDL